MKKTILYFQKFKCKADSLKRAAFTRFANSQGWTVSILDYTRQGWKTYSVFRRHFIAAKGMSPRAWRQKSIESISSPFQSNG